MRNPILISLREAVRAEIARAFAATGFATPRAVARVVCGAHPDEIGAIGDRLAEDALTELTRRELKHRTTEVAAAQLPLPGMPEGLRSQLPPAISIPAEGDEADDDGVIYKPLAQATLNDLEAHLALLTQQIIADTRRQRALKELRDLAVAAGATADSHVVSLLANASALEVA